MTRRGQAHAVTSTTIPRRITSALLSPCHDPLAFAAPCASTERLDAEGDEQPHVEPRRGD
jgi:hypothetical protein